MSNFNTADLAPSAALLALLVFGLILMLADAFKARRALPWLAGIGLLTSTALAVPGWLQSDALSIHYSGMIAFGGIAALVHIFLCAAAFFALFFIEDFFRRHHKDLGDVYALLLFSLIGMVMLANGNDLIILFVGLEVMSVALYIMAGLFKRDVRSNEAGLKYFLLGAFSSAFLLYGIALIYGMAGTTRMDVIQTMNLSTTAPSVLYYPALGLLLVGFLFKIAAFPFHSWTPDVYTGTPTPLAGFMASGSKMSAFIALAFFLQRFMPTPDPKILTLLAVLAVASMVYGNIVASRQTNLKRMLAYSSIAHTGYLMLGLCAGPEGYQAVIFYMVVYMLMTTGAFGIISIVENTDRDAELEAWKGLGMRRPWVGIAMSVFLFSLAGVPPLAGFMSKFQVFSSAVHAEYTTLAVIGILTSVIGAFYYLRVIVVMFFQKPETGVALAGDIQGEGALVAALNRQVGPMVGAVALMILLLILGIWPSLVDSYMEALYAKVNTVTAAVVR